MANTKIDSIKLAGSTETFDIDLPKTATPTIAGLSVTGSSNLTDIYLKENRKLIASKNNTFDLTDSNIRLIGSTSLNFLTSNLTRTGLINYSELQDELLIQGDSTTVTISSQRLNLNVYANSSSDAASGIYLRDDGTVIVDSQIISLDAKKAVAICGNNRSTIMLSNGDTSIGGGNSLNLSTDYGTLTLAKTHTNMSSGFTSSININENGILLTTSAATETASASYISMNKSISLYTTESFMLRSSFNAIPAGIVMGVSANQTTYSSNNYNKLYANDHRLKHHYYKYIDSDNQANSYYGIVETKVPSDNSSPTSYPTSILNTELLGHFWILIPLFGSDTPYPKIQSSGTASTISYITFHRIAYLDAVDPNYGSGYIAYYPEPSAVTLTRTPFDLGLFDANTVISINYQNCFLIKIY